MALPIRPGVYKQEFDNSITMAVGGIGGIGVPARFEKGEIGVAVQVQDRESLERLFGKPIPNYNTEDYAYIDNIFYYTSNLVLSRVEDTEHKYTKGVYTSPCENAQALIYNDGNSTSCNNVFNVTAITKDLDSTDRRGDWNKFVDSFYLNENPNSIDYSIMIKNSTEDFEEKYTNEVNAKTRKIYSAIIDLIDNLNAPVDSSNENLYKLTQNISQINNGTIIVQKNGNSRAVAKVVRRAKFSELNDSNLYGNHWIDGARIFRIKLIKAQDVSTDMEAYYGADTMLFDASRAYEEIGVLDIVDGTLDLIYNKFTTTLSNDDLLVALTNSDISNADGVDEADRIANAIFDLVEDNSNGTTFAGTGLGVLQSDGTIDFNTIDGASNVFKVAAVGSGSIIVDDSNNELIDDNGDTLVDDAGSNVNLKFQISFVNLYEESPIQPDVSVDFICYSNFEKFEGIDLTNLTLENSEEFCRVIAKTPGKWANTKNIEVMVCPMNEVDGYSMYDEYAAQYFNFSPNTDENGKYTKDQIAVVVFVDGSALEKYIVSVNPEAKTPDGLSNYWNDVINNSSQYIYFAINPTFVNTDANLIYTNKLSEYIPRIVPVHGGNSSTKISPLLTSNAVNYSVQSNSVDAVKEALKAFANRDSVELEYLCDGAFAGSSLIKDALVDLAVNTRCGDCVVVVGCAAGDFQGVHYANEGYDVLKKKYLTWANNSADNQYVAFYANTKQVYDSVNDQYVWISCSSDGVGANSKVDSLYERWYAVAGTRRGVLTNTIKLGWYPDDASREKMTKDRLNPVIYQRGEGNMIYDTMSLCGLNSDLSEFYNRKTLNYLQVNTEKYMRNVLFEFNDATTRSQIVEALTPFYRSVYNRRGLSEYQIQCDERINTPAVVAQGICYVDVIIKMVRCIKRLVVRYRVTAQTASLQSVSEE